MPSFRSLTTGLLAACLMPTGAVSSILQTPFSSTTLSRVQGSKPQDWINGFNTLTSQFHDLAVPTKEVTGTNAFLIVANEGPLRIVLDKAVGIIHSGEELLDDLGNSDPIATGGDSDAVLEAYKETVKAGLFWANLMLSRSNSFKGPLEIYKPIGALGESALRGILDIFEGFGFAADEYLQGRSADVAEQTYAISKGFDAAIHQYMLIKTGALH